MTDPVTPVPAAPNQGAGTATPPPAPPANQPASPSAPATGTPPAQPAAPPVAPGTPGAHQGQGGAAPGPNQAPNPQTPATPAGTPPSAPAEYALKPPKDSLVSQARIDQLKASAKERGLSNDQAQAELERENEILSQYAQGQTQTLKQMQERWVTDAKADPEIGGEKFTENVELAKRVINRFGSDTLKQELNATQYGNHPELLRIFTRIGREMAPDQLVLPEGGSAPKKYARAEDLYDHPTSQKG